MSFTFRPAKRESVGLLIGLASASGGGKTYSAMRLAKGISGDKPFAVIDTEARRALHYADRGFRFDHLDFNPPFSPDRYAEAITAADAAHYPVIVVDSASHEHAGEGGILDMQEAELTRMAGDDWKKRESVKMASWIKPKGAHKRMVQKLLQVRAHLILCFRAEEKIEMVRGENGKMEVRAKRTLTGLDGWVPICEKSLPFELTASFLLVPNEPGVPHPIKLQEQHKPLFPAGQLINEEAGVRLAEWAHGTASAGPAPASITAGQTWTGLIESVEKVTRGSTSFFKVRGDGAEFATQNALLADDATGLKTKVATASYIVNAKGVKVLHAIVAAPVDDLSDNDLDMAIAQEDAQR